MARHAIFVVNIAKGRGMDVAAIEALASTASTALVTAVVTDSWEKVRRQVAAIFGRGKPDPQIERTLDATHAKLAAAAATDFDSVRTDQASRWAGRFEDLLATYPDAAAELTLLIREIEETVPTAADHSGVAGRDMTASADHGSGAANVIHGNITVGPTSPGPASS